MICTPFFRQANKTACLKNGLKSLKGADHEGPINLRAEKAS